jgi:hypothetical protein
MAAAASSTAVRPLGTVMHAWHHLVTASSFSSRRTTKQAFLLKSADQTCIICGEGVILFPASNAKPGNENDRSEQAEDVAEGAAWSGASMGLPEMFLCNACVCKGLRSRALPIPPNTFVCDFQMWDMFREEDGAVTCAPFDLREGWHRDVDRNEDLCCHHAQRLLVSADPKHAEWKAALTKRYSVADLVRFSDTADFATRLRALLCCRSGARFGVEPVELQPPPSDVPAADFAALVDKATDCVFVDMKRNDGGRTLPMEDLTLAGQQAVVSGAMQWMMSVAEPWLMREEAFANLAEWAPFDADSPDRFALVNCFSSSSLFGQVAIYNSPHLTLTEFTLAQYLSAKRDFDVQPVEQPNTVICDECDERGYKGDSWLCCPQEYEEMWAYDICSSCLAKSPHAPPTPPDDAETKFPHQHGTNGCDLPLKRRPRTTFLQTQQ